MTGASLLLLSAIYHCWWVWSGAAVRGSWGSDPRALICDIVVTVQTQWLSVGSDIVRPSTVVRDLDAAAAARLVLALQPRDHIKPTLFELHWLWVHLRIDYKLCLLMHSATVQCCPKYISDIVQTTAASSRRQRLRSSMDTFSYIVPLTFKKFGEWAFTVAGPSVWNSLTADIRHITDISTFKRHLKTHLFICYFNTKLVLYLMCMCLCVSFFSYILNSVIRQWTAFCN